MLTLKFVDHMYGPQRFTVHKILKHIKGTSKVEKNYTLPRTFERHFPVPYFLIVEAATKDYLF